MAEIVYARKIPFFLKMWFILLLLFSLVGTIPAIILFLIRLKKFPEKRGGAWKGMVIAVGIIVLLFVLILNEDTNEKTVEQYIKSGDYEAALSYVEENYSTSNYNYYSVKADIYAASGDFNAAAESILNYCGTVSDLTALRSDVTHRLDEYQTKVSDVTLDKIEQLSYAIDDAIAEKEAKKEAEKELTEQQKQEVLEQPEQKSNPSDSGYYDWSQLSQLYSKSDILSVLFHEPWLKEYGIKTNYSSERKKAISKIETALSGEYVYLKGEKGGWLQPEYFEVTMYSNKADCIYYGKIKDNRPNGFGVMCDAPVNLNDLSTLQHLCFAGYFSNGSFDGYIVTFSNNAAKNSYYSLTSRLNKEGISNAELLSAYYLSYVNFEGTAEGMITIKKGNVNAYRLQMSADEDSLLLVTSVASLDTNITNLRFITGFITGTVKEYHGKLLKYNGGVGTKGFDGRGKLYFDTGELQYDGEFKDGKYDGVGTLYDVDGSVIYKGKWKEGDYTS